MRDIVITGIRGFVGTNLKEYLERQNKYRITGSSRDRSFLSHMEKDLSYTCSYTQLLQDSRNYYSYIHLTGKAYNKKEKNKELEYDKINFELTREIFDRFINDEQAKKFIFLSTIHVLTEISNKKIDETEQPEPFTPYGRSKFKAEKYIRENCPGQKKYYILRPSMIHGPGVTGNLRLLFNLVNKRLPYPIGAYNNKRTFLSIENLCFVIDQILRNDIDSGIYHIADDSPTYTHDIIQKIAHLTGKKARIWRVSPRLLVFFAKFGNFLHLPFNEYNLKKLTSNFLVSNEKIKKAIDQPLPITADEGLNRTINALIKRNKN